MLKIRAFNIQGGLNSKLGGLDGFLAKHKYDIVALQETRHKKSEKIVVKGYKA
jgi:exonuclease III